MYKKILVASDGSIYARKAIDVSADLAKRYKSELTLITVIQHPMNAFGMFGIEELGSEAYEALKKKGNNISRTLRHVSKLGEKVEGWRRRRQREEGLRHSAA